MAGFATHIAKLGIPRISDANFHSFCTLEILQIFEIEETEMYKLEKFVCNETK